MRIEETKLYKFSELSEESKEKAIEHYRTNNYEIAWQDEIFDSLKALLKTAYIDIKDYQLGLEGSYLKLAIGPDVGSLTRSRAIAWLENNLFSKLRMTRHEYLKNRKDNFRYGYRVGTIKDCPLTGYCADEDFLYDLKQEVIKGSTLGDSFKYLANTYQKLLKQEYEDQNSEEYIRDHFEANEYEFTESGNRY